MAFTDTEPVYLLKYDGTSATRWNYLDRDDDQVRLAAINLGIKWEQLPILDENGDPVLDNSGNQLYHPPSRKPGRDYVPIVTNNTYGAGTEIIKIYDETGNLEITSLSFMGSGTLISSILSSDALPNDFSTLNNEKLLTAGAIKSLVDSLLSSNDAIDNAARQAVKAELEAAFAQADLVLRTDLTAEVTRAQAAEAANATAISNEVTRAQAAEAANATAISNEVTRAQAAEAANATAISNEVTRAQAAEAALQGSIDAIPDQIAAAIADNDTVDAAARAAVSTAFADADVALQQSLDAEVTRAQAAEATLQNNIDAEATARAQAITDAIGGVDLSGIATNTASITAEVTRAQAAEATLQGNIDANTALIQEIEGGAAVAQVAVNTAAIATNAAAISNEIDARTASDLLLQADILTLDDKFDTLVSSSIPASYLLKVDGNDVVISTDGVNTGNDDPDPNNLTAIQELYAQINSLITQALPSSTMFKPIGADYVVTGFLTGHAGGSLLEFSTGDIILPTAPTGFPEEAFRLSNDYTEIIFGE